MASAPTVSCIIPVYNAGRYLREAVGSILRQTFTDFEFIAVDDGSTDNSLKILKDMERTDRRMRVISRPNTGVSGAANDGIAAARGRILARMDSDDIALPTRFEKQVAFLDAHPEVVLLGTRVLLIDPYGVPLHEGDQKIEHEEIEREMLKGVGWAIAQPTSMIRRAAFDQTGGYRTDRVPSEDLDLFLRLAEIGRIANLPDILLQYRQHPQSANHTRFEEQNALKRAILTEAHARRGIQLAPDWVPPKRDVLPLDREINLWGWKALKEGYTSVARKHAMHLVRMHPFSKESWRLMVCALRGR